MARTRRRNYDEYGRRGGFQFLRDLVSLGKGTGSLLSLKDIEGIKQGRAREERLAGKASFDQNMSMANYLLNREKFDLDQEKFERKKEHEDLQLALTRYAEMYNTLPMGDPGREWASGMMEGLMATMSPMQRSAFEATRVLRPISPQEKNANWFFKMKGPRPGALLAENGEPLPLDEKTEAQHAQRTFEQLKYDHEFYISTEGKEKGEAMHKMPTFITPRGAKGLFYAHDPATQRLIPLDPKVLGGDPEKYEEWGYTWPMIANMQGIPTGPPVEIISDGMTVRRIPIVKFDGSVTWDTQFYGRDDKNIKAIPNDILDAMSALEDGNTSRDAIDNPRAFSIVERIKEYSKTYPSPEKAVANMKELNDWLDARYPQANIKVFNKGRGKGMWDWFTDEGSVIFEKTGWKLVPGLTEKQVFDSLGQEGRVYTNDKDEVVDAGGNKIKGAYAPEDGMTVEELEFFYPEAQRTTVLQKWEQRQLLKKSLAEKNPTRTQRLVSWLLEGMGTDRAAALVESWGQEFLDTKDVPLLTDMRELYEMLAGDMGSEKAKRYVDELSKAMTEKGNKPDLSVIQDLIDALQTKLAGE